jgi:hypothetical protein
MTPDRNKTLGTRKITAVVMVWMDNLGFKPVETEVQLRRVRMNGRDRGVSNEEILESAASIGNARGSTPYEVLLFWVRTGQSVFPSPPFPFEDNKDLA